MKYILNNEEINIVDFDNYVPIEFGEDFIVVRKKTVNELNEIKLNELTNWFDNFFDKQLTQSLWQDDFVISHDDYFNKDYANIDELKAQAKIVRNEIRELRA